MSKGGALIPWLQSIFRNMPLHRLGLKLWWKLNDSAVSVLAEIKGAENTMNNRRFSFAVFLLACALLFMMSADPAAAQQTSGSISGVVQDSQGAVIPGADVVLINQSQGAAVRQLVSGDDGSFVFTSVPPGTYSVSVELAGFKKYVQQDIILNAQSR